MKQWARCVLVLWLALVAPVFAGTILNQDQPITASGGFVANCTESSNFLARTSGLSNTDKTNYDALICGLVTDGIFANLDILRIYAAPNTTTALLNLVSSSYNGTSNGSPTFVAYTGYNGTDGSTTIYIDSNFNPSTASGHYTQNLAHMSAWFLSTAAHDPPNGYSSGSGIDTYIWNRFSTDGKSYLRINASNAGGPGTPPTYNGFFGGDRNGTTLKSYLNATEYLSLFSASQALLNLNFYELGYNGNGTPHSSGSQLAMWSVGANFTPTQWTNYYNRLRTYMTAVGVP